jgi:Family of unknown function (DUF6076)
MQGTVKVEVLERGRLRVEGKDTSAAFMVNAILGLRDEPSYLDSLEDGLGRLVSGRTVKRLIRAGVPDLLRNVIDHSANGGFPSASLAEPLGKVRQRSTNVVEVPSLLELAVFALHLLLQQHGYVVRDCAECGFPWLTQRRDGPRYCYRPAFGRSETCAQLHAHERFAEKRDRWNKEYRRISARKRRGTVKPEEWSAWRDDKVGSAGAPDGFWVPFDLWRRYRHQQERLAEENATFEEAMAKMDGAEQEEALAGVPLPALGRTDLH